MPPAPRCSSTLSLSSFHHPGPSIRMWTYPSIHKEPILQTLTLALPSDCAVLGAVENLQGRGRVRIRSQVLPQVAEEVCVCKSGGGDEAGQSLLLSLKGWVGSVPGSAVVAPYRNSSTWLPVGSHTHPGHPACRATRPASSSSSVLF